MIAMHASVITCHLLHQGHSKFHTGEAWQRE